MVIDNYETIDGSIFYDDFGDAHFVGNAVGSMDFPDIGADIIDGANDFVEAVLLIVGLSAAAYVITTEGKKLYEYFGSKFRI